MIEPKKTKCYGVNMPWPAIMNDKVTGLYLGLSRTEVWRRKGMGAFPLTPYPGSKRLGVNRLALERQLMEGTVTGAEAERKLFGRSTGRRS